MTVSITDRNASVGHWEFQDYALDRATFGANGFELILSRDAMERSRHPDWMPASPRIAGTIISRNPTVYRIDVWTFSFLAVELDDLARLPLVIHRCRQGKRDELAWTR